MQIQNRKSIKFHNTMNARIKTPTIKINMRKLMISFDFFELPKVLRKLSPGIPVRIVKPLEPIEPNFDLWLMDIPDLLRFKPVFLLKLTRL